MLPTTISDIDQLALEVLSTHTQRVRRRMHEDQDCMLRGVHSWSP